MILYTEDGQKTWVNRARVTHVEQWRDDPAFVSVCFGDACLFLTPFTPEELTYEGFKEGLRPSVAFDTVYEALYSKY